MLIWSNLRTIYLNAGCCLTTCCKWSWFLWDRQR